MKTTSRRDIFTRWITLSCAVLLSVTAIASPAIAEEPAAPSLKLIPGDASFYASSLRHREQFDIVANSNWWSMIQESEQYQQAMMLWQMMMMSPDSPTAQLEVLLEDPANQQLADVLLEMVSDEVFLYGGAGFSDAIDLLQDVGNASNRAAYARLAAIELGQFDGGGDDELFMARAILDAMSSELKRIQIPEFVVGFKIDSTEPAEAQLKRLEAYATVLLEMVPEAAILRGKFKRQTVAGSDYLTLTLDGEMVPWNEVPIDEIAEEPGQYDALIEKLKGMELVISIGIHQGYVLLSVGPSVDHLEKLGTGEVLADAERLEPLRAMGDKRYTGVSYMSASLMQAVSWTSSDLDALADLAKIMLPAAELDDDVNQAILADIEQLKKDLVPMLPEQGDMLSFSFLNGRGYEGYTYSWAKNQLLDSSQPLPVLEHLGGKPILAIAGRGVDRPENYDLMVKWLKKGKGYFEDHLLETMREDDQEAYAKIAEVAYPAIQKADDINRNLLLPSLADGQCALVVDGLSTSTQWHTEMPLFGPAMPMPLPAVIVGLSDAEKFKQALGQYKQLMSDTLEKLVELAPEDIPPITFPEPKEESVGDDLTLYSFALPAEAGFDEKVSPNLGINENFAVFSLTLDQTKRLAKPRPLSVDGGPLADTKQPLGAVIHFDFHAVIDTAQPWIEEAVREYVRQMEAFQNFDDEEEEEFDDGEDSEELKATLAQVEFWLSLARAMHGYSSVTYEKDGAIVTHAELRIEDVE